MIRAGEFRAIDEAKLRRRGGAASAHHRAIFARNY